MKILVFLNYINNPVIYSYTDKFIYTALYDHMCFPLSKFNFK